MTYSWRLWDYLKDFDLPFEAEAFVNNIWGFRLHLKENTTSAVKTIKLLILFKEVIAVHCENHTNP
jgi:hypothetical protein